jgi:ribonuclease HII
MDGVSAQSKREKKPLLKPYYKQDSLEVGIDEAGRGCLFGPVCVGAVVWNPECPEPLYPIRDSKKCSEKVRNYLRKYIVENAIAYSVQFVSAEEIDKMNILNATMAGMHRCIDDIRETLEIDRILVDGTTFPYYTDHNLNVIEHVCIPGGDNLYQSIGAASILAKTYRDEYIQSLVSGNPSLERYGLGQNKGYGTSTHMDALKLYGPSDDHRKSFKPCR